MERPRILGHRGAPRVRLENTLPSFEEALAQGADGVELDARLAADGTLVVVHDATLERVGGGRVRVGRSSAWALSRIRLRDGATVPSLARVLDAMRGAFVNLEIKTDDGDPGALAEATVALLRTPRFRASEVIVSSFDPRVLLALAHLAPGLPRGLLLEPDPAHAATRLALGLRARPHAIHPHHLSLWPERAALLRAGGRALNVWTVDAPDDVRRVAALGVASIISNEPGAARAALEGADRDDPAEVTHPRSRPFPSSPPAVGDDHGAAVHAAPEECGSSSALARGPALRVPRGLGDP